MAIKRASGEPTISDIAVAAGVSKATVSRVMNGVSTVNAEIAGRVRETIAVLGYSPSATARSLSTGENRTVGVVVPDLANPMFHQVLHGLNRAAERDGYRLLVSDTLERSADEERVARDVRNRTDAIVLFSPRMPAERLSALLERLEPVVVLNRGSAGRAADVVIDYAMGVRTLAEHLIGLGHRRIGYLEGPAGAESNMARRQSLTRVESAHRGVVISSMPGGSTFEDGYGALPVVREAGVTAVIAFNDVVALGLIGRMGEEGVRVPEGISVVGFDDIPFARFASPSLTTMSARLGDVGESLWMSLRADMGGESREKPIVFTPELVSRGSSGAVPK